MGSRTIYDWGTVDRETVETFTSRKAFIYFLEIFAQVLPAVVLARFLPEIFISFVDNEAGRFALEKGYGRDQSINGVLAAYWSLAARMNWYPHFERVPSKANVSDGISRADLSRAIAEGWTRIHSPLSEVCHALRMAAGDVDRAINEVTDRFLNAALDFLP